jgi:hypothetical protein
MDQDNQIQLFENKKIRSIGDFKQEFMDCFLCRQTYQ